MIYQMSLTHGKKTAKAWVIGRSRSFQLTSEQKVRTHHELMKRTGCYDQFACSWIHERNQDGSLEIVGAGNYY